MSNLSVGKLRQRGSNASTLRPGPNSDPSSYRSRSVVPFLGSLGRISTIVPFPDLNLLPDFQPSTAENTVVTEEPRPVGGLDGVSDSIFTISGVDNRKWIKPPQAIDISNSKEDVPVYLYNNDIDDHHQEYEYITKAVFPSGIFGPGEVKKTGCDCKDSCTDDCLCAKKNDNEFAYLDDGRLLRGKHVVFECGELCKCGPSCKNRVTQKGLRTRLEVFRRGVRTLDLIEAGAFVCEYAGVAVTRDQAWILSMNGDVMIYPAHFSNQRLNWGEIHPNYDDRPNLLSLPPLDFAIDVSVMRNVAYYISHSKEPNLMVQFVLYDHNDLRFPRVMLFAMENISPMTELTLDYGFDKLLICN